MISALYKTNTFNCIFIVLAHWNSILLVDMSRTASQYLLRQLQKAVCLAEKQQILILGVFRLTQLGLTLMWVR